MKKIYVNIPDRNKLEAVTGICREQKIELYGIKFSDVNKTLAALCNVPLAVGANGKAARRTAPVLYVLPEMLIFFGLDDKDLDLFLDAYKLTGQERISRKAVVTTTNLGWTLYELAEELGREAKG